MLEILLRVTARLDISPNRSKTGNASSWWMRKASSSSPRTCQLAPYLIDVGDLAQNPCPASDVAQALVDRQFLFSADAQSLVQFATQLIYVGDHCESLGD